MKRARPAQAICVRCKELFVYFRKSRPRKRCASCVEIVAQESSHEYNQWRAGLRGQGEAAHV